MTWAEEVRAIIGRLGMSQAQFARFLGVSNATVNRWYKGHNVPPPLIQHAIRDMVEKYEQREMLDGD